MQIRTSEKNLGMNLTQRARIPKRKRFRFGIATKSLEKVVSLIRHTEQEGTRATRRGGRWRIPTATPPKRPKGGGAALHCCFLFLKTGTRWGGTLPPQPPSQISVMRCIYNTTYRCATQHSSSPPQAENFDVLNCILVIFVVKNDRSQGQGSQ